MIERKSFYLKIFSVLMAVVVIGLMTACPGGTTPTPYDPNTIVGGESGTLEAILAEGPLDAFSLTPPPTPAEWNLKGEHFTIPNPFQFVDGSILSSNTQWPQRRAEISKIIQYYLYGELPPAPSNSTYALYSGSSGTNPWNYGVTTSGRLVITMTHNGSASVQLTAPITLPSTGTGPYIAFNLAEKADPTWAIYDLPGQGSDLYWTDTIGILYGYGTGDTAWRTNLDAPSALMCSAWGMDRFIDGLEWVKDQAVAASTTKYIDPTKVMFTGSSRTGKQALVIGAFSERLAIAFPNSSGALGAAMERFLAPATGKIDYYFKFVGDGAPYPDKANYNSEGSQVDPWGVYVVKETDDWDRHYIFGKDAKGPGLDQGFQTQPHIWSDSGGKWPNERNKQFTEQHREMNIDKENQHGYMSTMPYDQNFVTALVAPRGLLLTDGTEAYWCNPESTAFTYLATREVYEFLGKPNALGLKMYDIVHSGGSLKKKDIIDFANGYYANADPDATSTPVRTGPTSFKYYPYTLDDPRSKNDYVRLNWKYPGSSGKTIRDQVLELIP
jgi:hypothetical protein